MKSEKEIKETFLKQYQQDKTWVIDYHNKGDVEIYNMIFGRLQALAILEREMDLGLNLMEDFKKNVPWNDKLLAGYRHTTIEYNKDDVKNLNESV